MRRLIKSDIRGLFWDKSFIISIFFSVLLGAFMPIIGYANKVRYGEITVFEDGFFIILTALALVVPSYVSLYVGKSFDWGTIRNKLSVGKTRVEVYLSFLITSLYGTFVLFISFLTTYTLLGVFLLEKMDIPLKAFVLLLFSSVFVVFSITALSVAIVNTTSSRVLSLVFTLFVVIALLMIGSIAVQMLLEPEMITNSFTVVDGKFVLSDPYPNPRYVKESQRWIWEIVRDSILGGQIHQITALECNPLRVSFFSIAFGSIVTALGCILFNRKDLK